MANRVDKSLTAEEMQAAKDNLAALDQVLEFTVPLAPEERMRMPKTGDKSQPFVVKALEAAEAHPDALPPAVKVDEFRRDVELHIQLKELDRRLSTLLRKVEDTAMVAGSEAYQTALHVYGYMQAGVKLQPGLAEVVEELGKQFRRQRAGGSKESKD